MRNGQKEAQRCLKQVEVDFYSTQGLLCRKLWFALLFEKDWDIVPKKELPRRVWAHCMERDMSPLLAIVQGCLSGRCFLTPHQEVLLRCLLTTLGVGFQLSLEPHWACKQILHRITSPALDIRFARANGNVRIPDT